MGLLNASRVRSGAGRGCGRRAAGREFSIVSPDFLFVSPDFLFRMSAGAYSFVMWMSTGEVAGRCGVVGENLKKGGSSFLLEAMGES